MSYFVGSKNVEDGIKEDGGFAINGGRGWSDVVFNNHNIDLNGNTAQAMGTYDFTDATDGLKTTVEYTFGYKKNEDGKVRIYLHHSSVPYSAPKPSVGDVSMDDVYRCQFAWAEAIKNISKVYKNGGDFVQTAVDAASKLYGYKYSNVLFKPTKAVDERFRPSGASAMSYFVGAKNVEEGIEEDGGFAINGGRGWSNVIFNNHQIDLNGNTAIAMGTYDFTDATDGSTTTVEYTFGYKKCEDGNVRIFLHHSSVPYSKAGPAPVSGPAPVTEAEVLEVQKNWAGAIMNISKVYKEGGEYITAAAAAAGELYAYGHEAAGFAINGGKGWADCVYDNHQVALKGPIAIAMGNYYFTCATTGEKTKVEYTFGYTRCADGKVRICVHHSSVPYPAGEVKGVVAPTAAAASTTAEEKKKKGLFSVFK